MDDDLGPLWETLPPPERQRIILHAGGLATMYEEPLEGEDPDEMLPLFINVGGMNWPETHAAILRRLTRAFIEGRRDPLVMFTQLHDENPGLAD